MLDDKQRKSLETKTVEMLLTLRGSYLAEQSGRPPLNYWTKIQDRMRSSARQCSTASEWVTLMLRKLQVPALHKDGSQVLLELVRFCDEHQAHGDLLDLLERDSAVLIALTQTIVEERKAAS